MSEPNANFWNLKKQYDLLDREWLRLFELEQHQTPRGQELLAEMNVLLEQISKEAA